MKHPNKIKGKKVAIFDIDGTIFRSSLLIEIVSEFIKEGIFSDSVKDIYADAYDAWLNRKDSYEKYIMAVVSAFEQNIRGISHKDFVRISKKIISSQQNHVYRYTRDLIKELKKKNYYILAISYSPKEILDEFCKGLGFSKVYGRMYETDKKGKFTGGTLYFDLISDKAKILRRAVEKENLTLVGSIGVGDSESDIAFLKLVERPICFNPNNKLYKYAKSHQWEMVVERKDVIYHLKCNGSEL
ncbi:MAG: HAD-IB family phosphatase [bacterium]